MKKPEKQYYTKDECAYGCNIYLFLGIVLGGTFMFVVLFTIANVFF